MTQTIHHRRPPQWLVDEIAEGLQKLYLLSLEGTPSSKVIAGTAMAWAEAIIRGRMLDATRDTPRIRDGFTVLAGRETRWPSPAKLLEAMPSIREPFVALPHDRRASPDVVEREVERCRQIVGRPPVEVDEDVGELGPEDLQA
jgi:hypothetical protein